MIKKILLLITFTCLAILKSNAQVTIFSEDFEGASIDGNAQNFTGPYLGWQSGYFTQQTNDNYWWILNNTRCNVITGNYSMAVSQNNPATTGTLPQYNQNRSASTLAYYTTPIDATNYTAVTLDFKWRCVGQNNQDYGTVLYSLDGNTWATLPGQYQGQATTQTVTNLNLSVVNGQPFYLGFGWDNNNANGGNPSFVVDDIVVKGTLLTPCAQPNQPTALTLTATDNTVNGTFTAAAPAPSNYLVVRNTSGTDPVPVDGTTYAIGGTVGAAGNIVVDTDNNTTFSATGLTPGTLYYFYVYSFNNVACSGGPNYNTAITLNQNKRSITTLTSSVCIPSSNNNSIYINNVSFLGTLLDTSNNPTGYGTLPTTPGYQNFTTLTTKSRQAIGEGINVYVEDNFIGGRIKAWVDWNKDNDFNDTGEAIYDSTILINTTTFGFVIPTVIPGTGTPLPVGDYRIRIRNGLSLRNNGTANVFDFTSCQPFDAGLNNNHQYGEAEDYLFTVVANCSARITQTIDGSTCGPGNVTLQVQGNGTEYRWYTALTGGTLFATTATGVLNTPLAATTTFYVTAFNGSCESLVRVPITGKVNPLPNVVFTPTNPVICGENDIIMLSASGDVDEVYLIDEDFEGGALGVFTGTLVSGNANSAWQNRTSPYVPTSAAWKPAISSGLIGNRFVMSNADYAAVNENILSSQSLNTNTFTNLTLSFRMYYSHYRADGTETTTDFVAIESSNNSTNGVNGTWTSITPNITSDVGFGTRFTKLTYNLSGLINVPNLRIRFRFYGAYKDGVAIDDVKLFGTRPLNSNFDWNINADMFVNAAATIPFIYGTSTPVSTIYVRPTLTQLENANFTIVAQSIADSGCAVTGNINVTNNTRVFNGGTDGDWNKPGNWLPNGIPDPDNCIIIKDNGTNPDAVLGPPLPPNPGFGKNLTVKPNGVLIIGEDTSLTITDGISVEGNGLFYLKNRSSLVQINNVANTGNIYVERAPNNGAAINNLNYVYWSTPVRNFGVDQISPGSSYRYSWVPTIGGNGLGNHGDWQVATGAMTDGKGYIVRGLSGVVANPSVTLTNNSALFTGVPTNGNISTPIFRGTWNSGTYQGNGPLGTLSTNDDDNWNLVGNPYPSAISADIFLNQNASASVVAPNVTPNQRITGSIWLWPHGDIPNPTNVDPFYANFVSNYAAQYIQYNYLGSTTGTFNGYIASGQAFFVLADHNNSAISGSNVIFHNGMRDATYSNSNFLRQAEDSTSIAGRMVERHRIWLNLVDAQNKAKAMLVGYASEATNAYDSMYDGVELSDNSTSFYSLIDDNKYSIQGRALPFNQDDTIPLGMFIKSSGVYKIAINAVDGLFLNTTQNIYLEDTYANIVHDLRISPYTFTVDVKGAYDDRFILRYTNQTLGVGELESNELTIMAPNGNYIKVKSTQSPIHSVIIYDLLGRALIDKKNINSSEFIFNEKNLSGGTYMVKATLVNGKHKIQKVILKQ